MATFLDYLPVSKVEPFSPPFWAYLGAEKVKLSSAPGVDESHGSGVDKRRLGPYLVSVLANFGGEASTIYGARATGTSTIFFKVQHFCVRDYVIGAHYFFDIFHRPWGGVAWGEGGA